jgi:soluble lytic murein transglycosylase-like protein
MVQSGYITRALEYVQQLRKTQKLKSYGYALSLGAIARGYYRYHKWEKSITMARYLDSLPLSSSYALDAYWWAGLAAWRQENYTESAEFFDKYVTSSQQSSEAKARGYYWSALASLMAGYPRHASPRLQKSCQESLEFYGYLACRTLSLKNPNHNKSSLPLVSDRPWTRTLSLPPVRRALALMEVGEIKKAISELRPLTSRYVAPSILKSIIRLAHIAHLPYISYLAAKSLFQVTGNAYLKALFPQPLWTPNGGYHIDRALIYAIIRQESHFNPFAKSRRQARGLMQIIPSTARFISKYQLKQRHSQNLYAPTVNIQLGQSYIRWLLSTPSIEGNLLKTLIAYNGGPGNMLTWKKRIADTIHPLLYIESLPPRETRKYVRHVLRNVWIYRDLMEQQPSSLRDILKSHWPLYAPQDQTQKHNNHSQASNQTLPKK